jgi:hypothetical protein
MVKVHDEMLPRLSDLHIYFGITADVDNGYDLWTFECQESVGHFKKLRHGCVEWSHFAL